MLRRTLTTMVACVLAAAVVGAAEPQDSFSWLEEIDGAKALEWVKAQNARTTKDLEAVPVFKPIYNRTLEIMDSKERIPTPSLHGTEVYNFWQDDVHKRGIWRRTSLASYRTDAPEWETVIDVDALSKADGQPWVFKGASCLPPAYQDCMVALSRGGSDAVVYREFDTVAKSFVKDGFSLPEAKSRVAWRDKDTLWLGTDFGKGSLTTSGYPRIVKLWKRGTPVSEAKTVFEGEPGDVASSGMTIFTPDRDYDVVVRTPAFFRSDIYLVLGGRLVKVGIPEDAEMEEIFRDNLLFSLRSDWKVGDRTYPSGALLAIPVGDLLQGRRDFTVLFEPTDRSSLARVSSTRDRVLISVLDNVRGTLYSLTLDGGAWQKEKLPLPGIGTVGIGSSTDQADLFFYTYQDFLTPSSLYLDDAGKVAKVKSSPSYFDASGMKIEQYEATSEDGTKIPYFVVTPKGFKADGNAPTLLYGYGGFEVSEVPRYSASIGSAWLERGGVYVLANIRGGGEFGPRWHQAAMKQQPHPQLPGLRLGGEGPHRPEDHLCPPPRHHGRLPGRPPGQRHDGHVPAALPRGGRAGAPGRHEALQPPPGRGELDGRVRQPRQPRGLGVHEEVVAVPEHPRGCEVPRGVLLDQHAGRPRAPVPRPQDGGQARGHRPQGLLLREHRGRARLGHREHRARPHRGAAVLLPLEDAGLNRTVSRRPPRAAGGSAALSPPAAADCGWGPRQVPCSALRVR